MSEIRRRARAFLGLPALDDPAAMRQPRAVPWRAAPTAFALTLGVLVALGLVLESVLGGRDNWQVNAPAIAALTAILLLAPSSSTQPKARNAYVAAIVGLAIVGAGFGVVVAGHEPKTAYDENAFVIVTVAALAGCLEFTALTRIKRWSLTLGASPTAPAKKKAADGDGPSRERRPADQERSTAENLEFPE